jgi:hypothetical protein
MHDMSIPKSKASVIVRVHKEGKIYTQKRNKRRYAVSLW